MTQATRRKAWSVVLAGTGINLALGILYTWSIFKGEIAKSAEFGWDANALNDPYAICCVVFAFAMILAGRVQDRYGPRVTAFAIGATTHAELAPEYARFKTMTRLSKPSPTALADALATLHP